MLKNSKLYEINTRVWLKKFGKDATLISVPDEIFIEFANSGFEALWLMGVWKTCDTLIERCCFTPDLISSYSKALKNWERKDIIGSPYAIDHYELNPLLGKTSDLITLKEKLNKLGLKLLLDFVPNHFSAESRFIKSNPEVFLEADAELLQRDPLTFFKPDISENIFVHGRDPFFLPWTDTIQVNYFNLAARKFMIDQLINIAEYCDGVRCDMAMLPLNNVFHNTWLGVLNRFGYKRPQEEFWKEAIASVKKKFPGFIFLAETYWDLEYQIQKLGFDFTYDKQFTDRLIMGDIVNIKSHLFADHDYQMKSVRFIENHDEERASVKFGKEKSLAAATVISTIKGIKLYNDGQLEGLKTKLPVQLGRQPEEKTSQRVKEYYQLLLGITREKIFKEGNWTLLEPIPAGEGNNNFQNFLTWIWDYKNDLRIVVINYSSATSQCRLSILLDSEKENITLIDLLTGDEYLRSVKEMEKPGLFIELKGFHSHIFSIKD
ncbi:MAG TPA: alpha-amylase family glycosyl hydrolase [Ignavibacteriaceae bacterium]|nr:alpha-amylase family glycosyl hydrolase [Ignavibacteriaceae bacterium]